jgi:hypothetical protein
MNTVTAQMLSETVRCYINDEIDANPEIGRVELFRKVRARVNEKMERVNKGRPAYDRVGSMEVWMFLITTGFRILLEIWKYRRESRNGT